MKLEQILLCYINFLPALGFSLIGPLFPPLFKDLNLSNQICSYIISIFSLAQITTAIYFPLLIKKIGRKNLFFWSIILEALCIFFYGIIVQIKNIFFFLSLNLLNRILHGSTTVIINILTFSITSLINEGEELEKATGYMEFFSMLGLAVGPVIVGIFFDIGGYSLPFIICSLLGFIRICMFYYITHVDDTKSQEGDNENKSSPSYIPLIKDFNYLSLILSFLSVLNTIDFLIPTLTNYLKDKWDISTSNASYFFLLSAISYTIAVQVINYFTQFFGNYLLITLSVFMASISALLIAPVGFLPQKWIFVVIGLFLEGFNQCFVNVPFFVELNNYSKVKFPGNEKVGSDIAATFFNLSYYVGELIFPIIGSFLTNRYNFQFSAYFCFVFCFIYSFVFYFYHKEKMKNLSCGNDLINDTLEERKKGSLIPLQEK